MRDTAASRNNLLPYPVITAAVQGDPDAVNRVIGHYSGYIAALSTRTSYLLFDCLDGRRTYETVE